MLYDRLWKDNFFVVDANFWMWVLQKQKQGIEYVISNNIDYNEYLNRRSEYTISVEEAKRLLDIK